MSVVVMPSFEVLHMSNSHLPQALTGVWAWILQALLPSAPHEGTGCGQATATQRELTITEL